MTVYFFVGSEFSNQTNFNSLNRAAALVSDFDEKAETVLFYPSNKSNLDNIAAHFKEGDVIIGASAGGHAARQLAGKITALNKPKPIIIGFEPFGLENTDGVITIVQAKNPKNIRNKENRLYELQDDNRIKIGNTDRHVFGHAFYAIHPAFIKDLVIPKLKGIRIDDIDYCLINKINLTVNNKTYTYENIIGKTTEKNSFNLDYVNTPRVFQLGFINNVVRAARTNTMDTENLGDGFAVKLVTNKQQQKHKFPESYNRLWQTSKTPLEQARAILNDYTKNDSFLLRFVHGHWNRHHTATVARLVADIDQKKITDIAAVLERLDNIKGNSVNFNLNGSLARRMSFISEMLEHGEKVEAGVMLLARN